MIALTKAVVPAFLLTWIVASIIGSNGSTGGMLEIFHGMVMDHRMYWSWSLFIASTALSWFIFKVLE